MRSRRISFVTRLFLVIFLLAAAPSLALLGLATWGLRNYVELAGGADAWTGVGETGRELLDAVGDSAPDSVVVAAAARHEEELSHSLRLARRWDLIAGRLSAALPVFAVFLGLALAALAALAARRFARGLARPVGELVRWSDHLAREEPLPQPDPGDTGGPPEFAVLRDAFRNAAARLAEGRRQALEAERLRGLTEMARRVAHEIKNPLTPLMLAVRQARGLLQRGNADAAAESLDVIASEAERLDEMARSFSQLGRLPEGPTSEIDLEEMLRALLASDVPSSIDRQLRVGKDESTRIEGHLSALNRAFRNLIGNAVEALAQVADGRIEVTVRGGRDAVEVTVADNGPGIPTDARERIWDPDFTTKKRGTGLGLALVRQTIRAHGGEIELRPEAAEEAGACFVVRIPLTGRPTP